jgi:hypothetical protein
VLETALKAQTVLNTLVTRYVRKLAKETERLKTRDTIRKRETENLRAIIKTQKERKNGKRLALKGQFHISTEELRTQWSLLKKRQRNKQGKRVKRRARTFCTKLRVKKMLEKIFRKRLIAILRIVL